uniref:NADH dehydrogenase [ubiquinone] 1 beta subcomplex subunit 5, mitochondrial n=1 Tax=Scapholeberis mucronata TaxID=202097 RepID=A0A4Y7NMW7_9CRUS|nr:EOG090X0FIE [Scapholeberis mucronata]SVE93936.1 EOG090X0FIE [Scapholeberis mucronata]
MAVISTLKCLAPKFNLLKNGASSNYLRGSITNPPVNPLQLLRNMSGHHNMTIKPSRWQWNRFKDFVHFYLMLGLIPSTLFVLYVNLFIGPAKLAEIPEGYIPEAYEYHSHPITRWMAKNMTRSYQQEYEMMCHHIYEEEYKQKLRFAEARINEKMRESQDTQTYYYEPVSTRYQKFTRQAKEDTIENTSTN